MIVVSLIMNLKPVLILQIVKTLQMCFPMQFPALFRIWSLINLKRRVCMHQCMHLAKMTDLKLKDNDTCIFKMAIL